jgi:methylglutamate dehydrogenase subunit D
VVDLIAKSPCAGLLPLAIGTVALSEIAPAPITSVMPYDGLEAAASELLKSLCGMGLPKAGRSAGRDGARAIWTGAGQAMVLGVAVDAGLARHAALSDQSDAWAVLRLDGAGAEDVLARLTPLDLNPGVFKRGHVARSLLGHMSAVIARVGAEAFEIMVFRSMAKTAVHELEEAMKSVAARAALGG